MATSSITKTNMCSMCSSEPKIAITTCDGCMKKFCRKHFNDHRDMLSTHFNSLFDLHNSVLEELQRNVNVFAKSSDDKNALALRKQIDEWETTTIRRVSEIAEKTRADIERLFTRLEDMQKIKQETTHITNTLSQQQKSESYVETDIDTWKNKLQELKADIQRPSKGQTNPPLLNIQPILWDQIIKISSINPYTTY